LSREIGFTTSHTSKGDLIGNLAQTIEEKSLRIHCEKTYEELRHYRTKEGGGTEAAAGYHDDHVMALALAVLAARSRPVALDSHRQLDAIERYYQAPKEQHQEGRDAITGY